MKLKKLIEGLFNEDVPKDIGDEDPEENIFNSPNGYIITGKTQDPNINKTSWDLQPEPQLLRYAKEIRRMKKDMKYFAMLPDEPTYEGIKSIAASTLTSLNNAEGKLRDLYEKVQWINKIIKNNEK